MSFTTSVDNSEVEPASRTARIAESWSRRRQRTPSLSVATLHGCFRWKTRFAGCQRNNLNKNLLIYKLNFKWITFFFSSRRLRTLDTLRVNSSESGRIDGDASVAFAFHLKRFVLADDFTAEFQRPTLVSHFDDFRLILARLRVFFGWTEFALSSAATGLHHRLQQGVLWQQKTIGLN